MGDTVIAQIATGGSWKTTIQLINMGTKPAQYTISFYDDTGSPLMLPLGGSGRVTSVSGQLSAGASRSIESDDTGSIVIQGWGWLQTSDSIGGQVILRQHVAGVPDFEGVTPLTSQSDRHFFMPFDQTNNFATGYAMANTSPGNQLMSIIFRDESGTELRRATLSFNGLSHQAFSLNQFPELAAKRGYAEISVPFTGPPAGIQTSIAVMGLRFNPTGAFTTLFPLILQAEKTF